MMALATCFGLLIGYGKRRLASLVFTAWPLIVSVAFFLIADNDSPREGSFCCSHKT
jgi:hypothetical protein